MLLRGHKNPERDEEEAGNCAFLKSPKNASSIFLKTLQNYFVLFGLESTIFQLKHKACLLSIEFFLTIFRRLRFPCQRRALANLPPEVTFPALANRTRKMKPIFIRPL